MSEVAKASSRKTPTLFDRILWRVTFIPVKWLMSLFTYYTIHIKKRAVDQKPTYYKTYPVRPKLTNNVWIPKTYVPGTSPLLPLLIDIHGGGFVIGAPTVDDPDNAIFCHKYGMCVVSIGYRKSPESRFPTAVEDVAAIIQAVLDDESLPVDKSRVALLGYSAGGNLSLAAPQLNGLMHKIKGVVAYYPVTDFTRTLAQRVASSTPPSGGRPDILTRMSKGFNWMYIRDRTDFENPLLSPIHAKRSNLPEKLYVLGCEYDILCAEARDAAEKYAAAAGKEGGEKIELGEGRTGWATRDGSVTWEELKGMEHGYNQRWKYEKREMQELWRTETEKSHKRVAEWLFRSVYDA